VFSFIAGAKKMFAKKALIVLAVLGIFSGSIAANEEYHVVKVWPEVPVGWHFYRPNAVAVDKAGNVYVADSGNYRIKKFDSKGRFIKQWGSPGEGDGQFGRLVSIKVDSSGNVFIVDAKNNRIQKFTPYGKFIASWTRQTIEGGKYAFADVAVDSSGDLFVTSSRPAKVLKSRSPSA